MNFAKEAASDDPKKFPVVYDANASVLELIPKSASDRVIIPGRLMSFPILPGSLGVSQKLFLRRHAAAAGLLDEMDVTGAAPAFVRFSTKQSMQGVCALKMG